MYAHSAAALLLATHCACCSRPLVDALSVELGMGPDCRKKYGSAPLGTYDWDAVCKALEGSAYQHYLSISDNDEDGDGSHNLANSLIWAIARDQSGEDVARATVALRALGYVAVADRIAKRLVSVKVTSEGDSLVVESGFNPRFNDAIRAVKGARWDAERKVRVVPVSQRAALWDAIKASFAPGTLVIGKTTVVLG